jgi:hypothetical protein
VSLVQLQRTKTMRRRAGCFRYHIQNEVADDQPKFIGGDLASCSRSSNFPSLGILRLTVIEIVLEEFAVQAGLSGRGEAWMKSIPDLNHRANTASRLR